MKKNFKKLVAISLILGSMISFAACANKSPAPESAKSEAMEKIKKNGKLVLGTSADFPPYEFHKSINGKDEIIGFDVEIAKEIAKDLGVQLEIKDMKFDGLLAALDQGNVDMVTAGMNPTPARKKNVDFSDIYYSSIQVILVRTEDKGKIKTADDLADKQIGVQKGAIQEDIAKKQVSKAKPVALGKISDIMLALKSKRIDAAIIELPVANANIKANPDLAISDIKIKVDEEGSAIAFKKGSTDLIKEANKTLDRLKKANSIDKFVIDANNAVE